MGKRPNPLQPLLEQIPKPLRNRYLLVLALFSLWMVSFDKHDVFTQWSLQQAINKLEDDKVFYREQIQQAWADRKDLEEETEKFAREKYHMSKPDEEVFLFLKESDR